MMTYSPFPPGSLVAAYLRDSGGATQEMSTAQQEDVIRKWCGENDIMLSRVFKDTASGGSVVGRAEFDAMLRHFGNHPQEAGVVLWSYNRLARNYDDTQFALAMVRRAGYQVFSLEERIPAGSVGKVVESLYIWRSEEFREELSRNTKRGLHYIIAQYKTFPRPTIPIGYKKEAVEIGRRRDGKPRMGGRLRPDPDKAGQVKLAFQMRAEGRSINEIHSATRLYTYTTSYRHLFTNKIYIGILEFGGVAYPEFCEPLVDIETWRKVQDIREMTQHNFGFYHERRLTSNYIFSGLLECGVCGGPMTGSRVLYPDRQGHYYYLCIQKRLSKSGCGARNVNETELEAIVRKLLIEYIYEPDILDELYRQAQEYIANTGGGHAAAIASIEKELSEVEKEVGNLVDAISATGHSSAMLARLTEREAVRDRLRVDMFEARGLQAEYTIPDMSRADFDRLAADAERILGAGELRDRQIFYRGIIEKIVVERVGAKRSREGRLVGKVYVRPLWEGTEGKILTFG